ncbi:hypothetical protein V502_02763 [Pseudogymnoascus sp. VKM F-4520 (FW-2644)]|nr:hypothetical protein V502_02763 [Pseudogymnoascus sp. VKM F-4520 (FW-2644)]
MASFCWIRPLQVGHGIRRSFQSRALLCTPKTRHPQKPLLFLPTHHRRSPSTPPSPRFTSSSTIPIPPDPPGDLDEAAQSIRCGLRDFKHDKWGWVIYRCSYGDDEAWTRFQRIINDRSRKDMAGRGFPPDLANSLEWTFVSDRASLDGASKEQLRSYFRAWVAEAEKVEQPRATVENGRDATKAQRYSFFIEVDEEALRSVADADLDNPFDEGWVNIVRCGEWDLGPEAREEERKRENIPVEDVEGDGDEGWMRISSHMVGPDFYDAIGYLPQDWYPFYRQPPGLVYW